MTDRPTLPEVMPLVWKLYASEHGSVGGHLHIVLDDGNVADSHVEYCIAEAKKDECEPCLKLARLLLAMSQTQRARASSRAYAPPPDLDPTNAFVVESDGA